MSHFHVENYQGGHYNLHFQIFFYGNGQPKHSKHNPGHCPII